LVLVGPGVRGRPEQKILIGFPPEQKKKRETNGPDPLLIA
jgi:hypothetical protein